MTHAKIRAGLDYDRCQVDEYLDRLLSCDMVRSNGVIQDAMRYAVLGPAQRIRPILALRVARLFGENGPLSLRAACSVELLHCASLIVDDLPCMDDSPMRRDQPSLHVKFGEATSVLAAFGLVALAARVLVEIETSPEQHRRLVGFQVKLLRSLDCSGLIAGQALDLQLTNNEYLRTDCRVTELKTVPLFQLAVAAGALFSELDPNEEALLQCFGREFGLAFQLTDDLLDGEPIDMNLIEDKFSTLRAALSPFGPGNRELGDLLDYLHARATSQRTCVQ
jgi:geranylgeranyl pyrophosphate synthase